MTARRATVWILTCDVSDCHAKAVPVLDTLGLPRYDPDARALTLAVMVDAFAVAKPAGWVSSQRKDYCPDHADEVKRA